MPAPRSCFNRKKRKVLSDEQKSEVLPKLEALKAEHAPKVLSICRIIKDALKELEAIEATVDETAEAILPDYTNVLQSFKLTFESAYREHGEDCDDPPTTLLDCADLIDSIVEDAGAVAITAVPNAATADAADE